MGHASSHASNPDPASTGGRSTPLGRCLPPGFYRLAPEGQGAHRSELRNEAAVSLGCEMLRRHPDACLRALLATEIWARDAVICPCLRVHHFPHLPLLAPVRGLGADQSVPELDAELESHMASPALRAATLESAVANRAAVETIQWGRARGASVAVLPVQLRFADTGRCHRGCVVADLGRHQAALCVAHPQSPGLATALRKALESVLAEAGLSLGDSGHVDEGHGAPLVSGVPDDCMAVAWAWGLAPLAMARRVLDGMPAGPAHAAMGRLREPHAWALAHLVGTWADLQPDGGVRRAAEWVARHSAEPLLDALCRCAVPGDTKASGLDLAAREVTVAGRPAVPTVVVVDLIKAAIVRHAELSHACPGSPESEQFMRPSTWAVAGGLRAWDRTTDDDVPSRAADMMEQEREAEPAVPRSLMLFAASPVLGAALKEALDAAGSDLLSSGGRGVRAWAAHLERVYGDIFRIGGAAGGDASGIGEAEATESSRPPLPEEEAAESGPGAGPADAPGNELDTPTDAPGLRPSGFVTDVEALKPGAAAAAAEPETEPGSEEAAATTTAPKEIGRWMGAVPDAVAASATGWMAPLPPLAEMSSADSVSAKELTALRIRLRAPWIESRRGGSYWAVFASARRMAIQDVLA